MSLLGLVADYGDNSTTSSDSEDESSGEEKAENSDTKDTSKEQVENALPLPDLDVSTKSPPSSSRSPELTQRATQSSSVFYNPFLAEEKKKLSVLEKHVQLSNIKEPSKSRARPRICFKFLKGKCRFGDKCKFSHAESSSSPPSEASTKPTLATQPTNYAGQAAELNTPTEEDSWEQKQLPKKHRSGVTDSLVPPKRSRAAYEKQRASERPWTMS